MKTAAECKYCLHFTAYLARCEKGHKPKYYNPRPQTNTAYGWKRVCDDFEDKRLTR